MQDSHDAVKDLASQIENQAKEVQRKVSAGEEFYQVCNELIRNAITLVFTSGEVYALESNPPSKKNVKVRVVKPGAVNYRHNVHDPATGRFAKKNP